MNRMRNILLQALLLVSLSAEAQRTLSLEEAITTALQNNYNILLAKNDSMAAAIDYSYKNAGFLPRINGTVGTVWNNNAQKQILSDGTKEKAAV